ncbi:hypothetical protein TorRG33x02_183450, partial [Trema orientale]
SATSAAITSATSTTAASTAVTTITTLSSITSASTRTTVSTATTIPSGSTGSIAVSGFLTVHPCHDLGFLFGLLPQRTERERETRARYFPGKCLSELPFT